jgi:hypothetical protein
MAKGATCPNCGEQTWRQNVKGGRWCSSCHARGWRNDDQLTGGGGKGRICNSCGAQTLVLVDDREPEVRYCSNSDCQAVVILEVDARA